MSEDLECNSKEQFTVLLMVVVVDSLISDKHNIKLNTCIEAVV